MVALVVMAAAAFAIVQTPYVVTRVTGSAFEEEEEETAQAGKNQRS